MDDGGYFLGELSGEGFNRPFRDAAFLGSPFRRLGNAVLFAQDIIFDFVQTYRMGLDIIFILGAFFDPDINNGQLEGRIGIGQNRNPLVGMDGGAVVQVRADIDLLDAGLRPEVADPGGILSGETPGSGLRVAAPEEAPSRNFR